MGRNYYDQQNRAANLAQALARRGWRTEDYRADASDLMTDYFSPARWYGDATRDGWTLAPVTAASMTMRASGVPKICPRGKGWALFAPDGRRVACGHLPKGETYGAEGMAAAEQTAEQIDAAAGFASPWNKLPGGLARYLRLVQVGRRLAKIRYYAETRPNDYCRRSEDPEQLAAMAAADKWVFRRGRLDYNDRVDGITCAARRVEERAQAMMEAVYRSAIMVVERSTFRVLP